MPEYRIARSYEEMGYKIIESSIMVRSMLKLLLSADVAAAQGVFLALVILTMEYVLHVMV